MSIIKRVNNNCTSPKVIWMYGLCSSGKTTLAFECKRRLVESGLYVLVLDGDELRKGICSDLGYDVDSRMRNVCRAAQLAKILLPQSDYIFVSLMTPHATMRAMAKCVLGEALIDVYIKCDILTLLKRDVKGLYLRAQGGVLHNLPGQDMMFEEPSSCSRFVDTSRSTIDECANKILSFIS